MTIFISDLMKSKPISLNLVIFVMFISRSISTLVNQEDSPTLSKTYLSGPISTSSQDHLQDHQESQDRISGPLSGLYQDHPGMLSSLQDPRIFTGPQEQARTDILQPYPIRDSRTVGRVSLYIVCKIMVFISYPSINSHL